jgi:hypothetical protein
MKKQLQQSLGSFSRFCIATFLFLIATPAFAEARTVPEEYRSGEGGFFLLAAIIIIGVIGGQAILHFIGNILLLGLLGAILFATYNGIFWPLITIGVILSLSFMINLVEWVRSLVK